MKSIKNLTTRKKITAEPVVGITATVEKEVGQVWSQHYYNVKVVTNKIQGGFSAKAAR
jgi:hypothetical protein